MTKLFYSLIVLVLVGLVAITVWNSQQHPIIIQKEAPVVHQQQSIMTPEQYMLNKSVSRLTNPLLPPERTPAGGPVPISIPSRGYPSDYQQVGVLEPQEDAPQVIYKGHMLLPLFGRQTYPGSHQWNYYSGNDNYATIKLPVIVGKGDCLAQTGCRELNDGDNVQVRGLPGNYKVQLYRMDAPRYYP